MPNQAQNPNFQSLIFGFGILFVIWILSFEFLIFFY